MNMKIKNELKYTRKKSSFRVQYGYQNIFPKPKKISRKWKKAIGKKNPRKNTEEYYKKIQGPRRNPSRLRIK